MEDVSKLVPSLVPTKRKAAKKVLRGKIHELTLTLGKVAPSYFLAVEAYDRYDKLFFVGVVGLGSFFFGECWSCLTQANHTDYNFLLVASAAIYTWYALLAVIIETGWFGEQSKLSLVAGSACGLLAYFSISVLQEGNLDFGLQQGWLEFREAADAWLASQQIQDFRFPLSLFPLRLLLALWAASWSYLTLWPRLRHVKSYQQIVELNLRARPTRTLCPTEGIVVFLAHLDFLLPLFLSLAWALPLTQQPLQPIMSLSQFRALRLYLVLLHIALRAALLRSYIQAYLSSAITMVKQTTDDMNQEEGVRIRAMLRSLLLYTPTIAIQLLGPSLTTLFLAFLVKRKQLIHMGVCRLFIGDSFNSLKPDFTLVNNAVVVPVLNFMLWWTLVSDVINSLCWFFFLRKLDATNLGLSQKDYEKLA
eukprot:gb/GEZN01007144.1/.p1 GENE.gb/GEZN01007144.1/~~gb/GEZN01007144.1/.p1  ORF type:complete len:488 (+),score=94.07 gb/GEZN01007144.1/:207-1466(+)